MNDLQKCLRQETAFVYSPQPQRKLTPSWNNPYGGASRNVFNFDVLSVGGAVFLQNTVSGPQPELGIHWQIENSSTGALHLSEFTVHGGLTGPRIVVETSFLLFPSLAVTGTSDGRLLIIGFLSNGHLLWIHLEFSSSADGIFGRLTSEKFRLLDLSQHLGPLGNPTSLAATSDTVAIGGSSGSVLCVPLSTLEDLNTSRCFELRDSSWALTKFISGVLYRPRQPAVLACVPVKLAHRQLLLVLYDDSVLRVFNVARRQHVSSLEFERQAAVSNQISSFVDGAPRQRSSGSCHPVPTYMAVESYQHASGAAHAAEPHSGVSDLTLVVEFEAPDTLSRYTYAYTLSSSSSGRLSLSSGTELRTGEEGVVVSEARVFGDNVWLLVKVQNRTKVLGFDRRSGDRISSTILVDTTGERASSSTGVSGNGAEVDQELWEWLLEAFPEHLSAEAQVYQQMLLPGQTCRASLREALSEHGLKLSSSEVDTASHAALRNWIQAAVQDLRFRTPSASAAECWLSFLASYRKHWARHHPPLGLVVHPGSPDWLGLARGGGMLCVLRCCTRTEVLVAGSNLEVEDIKPEVHRCVMEAGSMLGPLVLEGCLGLLVAGVDPLERLIPRLCELWHCGPAAAPADGGVRRCGSGFTSGRGTGSARAAALTDGAREAQQRWRQRRLQVLIELGKLFSSHHELIKSLNAYLSFMDETSRDPISHTMPEACSGGLVSAKGASCFLVSTARQMSRAVAVLASNVALVMGLIVHQGGVGSVYVAREMLVQLEGSMLPKTCEMIRRAALGLWLTGTPSSQDEAADMEPALSAFRHLRLGGSPQLHELAGVATGGLPLRMQHVLTGGGITNAAATPADASCWAGDVSLAARLLPAFSGRSNAGRLDFLSSAELLGFLFTMYLQYGGTSGLHLKAPLAARVLQLGYQLFQAGEYGSLADLAELAGANGSSEAGPQFLRGLGITCALALERQGGATAAVGNDSKATAKIEGRRVERIAEAAGCFFRAASSLGSDAGETLRTILVDLRAELAGTVSQSLPHSPTTSTLTHGPRHRREVALLQVHFCEAVMQLFERERAPEGAVIFAEAALEHLRTAYRSAGNPDGAASAAASGTDPSEPVAASDEHAAVREGRLWSNIYTYCMEMRQYDRAYAALLANPLPTARLQSLRHLVHALAQEGQLQTLCTLPFAGVAVVPAEASVTKEDMVGPQSGAAPYRTVSLLSEALDMLHRRAHHCDLSETPQPYMVLYDFLICRGDFKGAARAMAVYAWRLRAEGPSTDAAVTETLRAYDLAISCLSLLQPSEAWLDLTDPWVAKHAPHGRAYPSVLRAPPIATVEIGAAPSTAGADDVLSPAAAGAGDGNHQARRSGGAARAAPGGVDSAMVATLQSLQRERTLLYYCSVVAARVSGLEPLRQWDNEDAILRQLLLMGRYEGTLALVAGCYGSQGGDPWVKAMETVVKALAEHCTRLQMQDGGLPSGGPPLPPTDLFDEDPEGSGLEVASSAAIAATFGGRAGPLWGKLRQLLQKMVAWDDIAERNGKGLRVAWILRDVAANAVLSTDPRVNLPQWLQDMFLAPPGSSLPSAPAGMGSWSCGPASLLSLYIRYNQFAAAVELVCTQLALWSTEDVMTRQGHCAAWIPYAQLDELHQKLHQLQQNDQQRFGPLLEQLNDAVKAHIDLARMDTDAMKAHQLEGPNGSSGGGAGPVGFGGPPVVMQTLSPTDCAHTPVFGMGLGGAFRMLQ